MMASDDLSTPFSTNTNGYMPTTSFGIIISDSVLEILNKTYYFVVMPIILAWALLAGSINIAAFAKMGIREGINSNFLILSITDFLFALCQAVSYCTQVMLFMGYNITVGYIPLFDLVRLSALVSNIPKSASMVVSTAIAIVRCCFVTFPIRAPYVVTTYRQVIAIFILLITILAFYTSVYAHYRFVAVTNSLTNTTMVRLTRAPSHIYNLEVTFRVATFLFFPSIIFLAVVVLTISLKRAAKLREIMQSSSYDNDKTIAKREVHVIKCVVYVALVFLISNSPFMGYLILRYSLPDFTTDGRFQNEFFATAILMRLFATLDISCNCFGYYKFNTKFRTTVDKLFTKCLK